VKAEIRRMLNREKPKPKRRAYHRSVVYEQAKKPAHYLCSIADTQTPEQRRARELEAQMEAEKSAAAILLRRLSHARPTGGRCTSKACPFPAVLDGQCRQHAMDRAQIASLIPSPLGVGAIFLT
jgi:hypothetical protein